MKFRDRQPGFILKHQTFRGKIRVLIEKIKKYLLVAFLVLIPSQLGKHWWFEWSKVQGIRVDYLSPTLYLVDVIFIILVILNVRGLIKTGWKRWLLLAIITVVNVVVAGNKGAAGLGWIRIWEWILGVVILWQNRKLWTREMGWVVPTWVVWESGLGVAQVIKGGSLQGIWYWLGERRFTLNTIGVAQMGINGESLLRAYGTFSHPNSLAGFLLVSLLWMWELPSGGMGKRRILWWAGMWLGVLGILVSGSRTVWVLGLGALGWKYFENSRNKTKAMGYLGVLLGVGLMGLGVVAWNYQLSDYLSGWDQDGVVKRVELIRSAGRMVKENWFLGVGANNFLPELPDFRTKNSGIFWLQPVHNIPLLLLSELGVVGLLMAGLLTWRWRKFFKKEDLIVWGVIVTTGMIDHYWITLPQNRWLLAVWVVWNLARPLMKPSKINNL